MGHHPCDHRYSHIRPQGHFAKASIKNHPTSSVMPYLQRKSFPDAKLYNSLYLQYFFHYFFSYTLKYRKAGCLLLSGHSSTYHELPPYALSDDTFGTVLQQPLSPTPYPATSHSLSNKKIAIPQITEQQFSTNV